MTVTACALALTQARRHAPVLLVDLCGDAAAVLGQQEPTGPGLLGWLSTPQGSVEQLERLVVPVDESLSVLAPGEQTAPLLDAQVAALPAALAKLSGEVIVDVGLDRRSDTSDTAALGRTLRSAGRSQLVTRACYISLRRAVSLRREQGSAAHADGVVVVLEPGRALDARDVAQTLELPLSATVEADPSVARAVDAGLLARRIPRRLERCVAGIR